MPTAYISIGSNLGDRLEHLKEAVKRIRQSKAIEITKASFVYETQPVYGERSRTIEYTAQPRFLNMVMELKTTLEPLNLLELLLGIENQMGRTRNRRYGPRNIDLDLLLCNDLVLNSDKLTLPHPRMHERRFVLVPLTEIAPKVVHPLLKKSVERLLEELSADSASKKDEFEVRVYPQKI